MILILAEKYGQAPEDVENWDGYWIERAATLLEAENIDQERRNRER